MIEHLGLELDAQVVRAVCVTGWRRRVVRVAETPWDPDDPMPAVRALGDALRPGGRPGEGGRGGRRRLRGRVRLTVRLPLLHAKRVKLPPAPPEARRQVMRLVPERFFPVQGEELVVAVGHDGLAYAAPERRLTAWTEAFAELGPIDLVQPGPASLARALADAGIGDAVAVLDDGDQGVSVVTVRGRVVESARRIYGSLLDAARALADRPLAGAVYLAPWDDRCAAALTDALGGYPIRPLPAVRGVPPAYLSAYGVTAEEVGDLSGTLVPPALGTRLLARRRGRLAAAALACAASALFAALSLDARRAAAVRATESLVQRLEVRAAPVLALRTELETLRRRTEALARIERTRPDPLGVLLALSTRLPRDAQLRSLDLSGGDWQVEGYASQAEAVTEALAGDARFQNVRVLSANNRARVGDHTYESFSVAFRFAPAP